MAESDYHPTSPDVTGHDPARQYGKSGARNMVKRWAEWERSGEAFADLPRWAKQGARPDPLMDVAEKSRRKRKRKAANRERQKELSNKRKKVSKSRREAIYRRDGYRCVECGATEGLTLDHIVPLARGGSNKTGNLQTLCGPCNVAKGCT